MKPFKKRKRFASDIKNSEIDYINKLNETEKKWLEAFNAAIEDAKSNEVVELTPKILEEAKACRNAKRRDVISNGGVEVEPIKMKYKQKYTAADYNFKTDINPSSIEDAIIELIDAPKKMEKLEKFKKYNLKKKEKKIDI